MMSRIPDLEREVLTHPESLAFVHLADAYRVAGRHAEAIATCRAGLARHPTCQAARTTLARLLVEDGGAAGAVGAPRWRATSVARPEAKNRSPVLLALERLLRGIEVRRRLVGSATSTTG